MSEDQAEQTPSFAQRNRLRTVLNSDRASLSPVELQLLQQRIASALEDFMELEVEGIEFQIKRMRGKRILELRLPVKTFFRSDRGEER